MFDAATTALGPLTAVIANAGIVAPTAKLADMGAERMRRIFEVNVLGAFDRPRGRAPAVEILRRRRRSIALMSSAAARLGSPNLYIDYAASKGAIETLTSASREPRPEGVRVNAIRRAWSTLKSTPAAASPTGRGFSGATASLGRPGSAEEIAAAAIWLISDAASYVTGALLDVSGGRDGGSWQLRTPTSRSRGLTLWTSAAYVVCNPTDVPFQGVLGGAPFLMSRAPQSRRLAMRPNRPLKSAQLSHSER